VNPETFSGPNLPEHLCPRLRYANNTPVSTRRPGGFCDRAGLPSMPCTCCAVAAFDPEPVFHIVLGRVGRLVSVLRSVPCRVRLRTLTSSNEAASLKQSGSLRHDRVQT
ncbi:Semaphorin-3C, partial [Clarias magur]